MRELKIATIGAWGHLGRVLDELDSAPDLRIAAMAKSSAGEEPRAYHDKHPCARHAALFEDHHRMLDEARPDVVIISTRLDLIAPLALEAAERGCHLICEKPLAIEQARLRELWDTCVRKRVQCFAILNNATHPVIAAARQAVRDGRLGRIAILNARKSYKWGDRPQWFGRRSVYGGTIPWIGIHALDFIYSIAGQSFESVAAMHANVAHPQHAECEDVAALLLKLRNGTIATASLDLMRPPAADSHGDDWVRVVGSAGVLEANLTRNTCTLTTQTDPVHDLPLPSPQLTFVPILRALVGGAIPAEPSPEMRRAFLLTQASLCARDAADHGQIIPIDTVYEY